jgi:hypothetical protein
MVSQIARGRPIEKAGGGGAILIAKDDFFIAMEAESTLWDAGFKVSGMATTAEEALDLARESTGRASSSWIFAWRGGAMASMPRASYSVCSACGASSHPFSTTIRRTPAPNFSRRLGWVAKPYTMASLIGLIRQVIAKRSRGVTDAVDRQTAPYV